MSNDLWRYVPAHLLKACTLIAFTLEDDHLNERIEMYQVLPMSVLNESLTFFFCRYRFVHWNDDVIPSSLKSRNPRIHVKGFGSISSQFEIFHTGEQSVTTSANNADHLIVINPFIEITDLESLFTIRLTNLHGTGYTHLYVLMLQRGGTNSNGGDVESEAVALRTSHGDDPIVDWVIDSQRKVTYLVTSTGERTPVALQWGDY
eukprot:PhF_6_TR32975/c0_g1_i2/m.48549